MTQELQQIGQLPTPFAATLVADVAPKFDETGTITLLPTSDDESTSNLTTYTDD